MKLMRNNLAAAIILTLAASIAAYAQGPTQTKMKFTVDAPYSLEMGGYILPPGKYVLYQTDVRTPNTFWLYKGDMTHAPVALIDTRPVYLNPAMRQTGARVVLDLDEENLRGTPVLKGWKIRNWQGYQVSSVVLKKEDALVRAY